MKIAAGVKKCEICNTPRDFIRIIELYAEELTNAGSRVTFSEDSILVPMFENEEYFMTIVSGDEGEISEFSSWFIKRYDNACVLNDIEHVYLDYNKDILTVTLFYPSGLHLKVAVCILEYKSTEDEKGVRLDIGFKHPTRPCFQKLVDRMIVIPRVVSGRPG